MKKLRVDCTYLVCLGLEFVQIEIEKNIRLWKLQWKVISRHGSNFKNYFLINGSQ